MSLRFKTGAGSRAAMEKNPRVTTFVTASDKLTYIKRVPVDNSEDCCKSGVEGPVLLLAHGAGAGMDSDFMVALSAALVSAGVRVWRFEFAYMAQSRKDGRRRPPPAAPRLLAQWRDLIAGLTVEDGPGAADRRIYLGGKSMGGRMASLLATETHARAISGCLCFGYPFYPPAKPDKWRTEHFSALKVPTWIAQGERDAFGSRARVLAQADKEQWPADNPQLHWVSDGNHDFIPRKRSETTWDANLQSVARAAAAFMLRQP